MIRSCGPWQESEIRDPLADLDQNKDKVMTSWNMSLS